ncbi:MAG: SixA phosphatase family protein [Geminicoccaceae bacterium]
MRTLLLLRHAKSSWQAPELADVDRPLAPRGRQAAPLIAQLIVKRRWLPDLVLCSPALRVRETWQLMAPVLGEGIVCKTLRTIYPGAPSRLLATLHRADDEARTLMLIGHNPGLATFAASLCGRASSGGGSKKALEKMTAKFPTAGLAVIGFDAEHWSEVTTGAGRLEAFVRPKDLG